MKVSSRTQFGFQILCYLALRYGGAPVQGSELATVTGTTEKYIGQIMLTLRASPLVLSSRGAQGGYYLARHPASISLYETLLALEGELPQFEPLSGFASQEFLNNSLKVMQSLLTASLANPLKAHTLEDLVRQGQQASGFGDWVI
ncbi:RrF2 family transcriptional regulator [Gracilinema caldarium]|uniref:Transcriptional regulator, BadM/Rrf2 family n=1 Tax=Gracilinema caldarium (strain ATCC 51460 / DSM 7334 / H1) TaxID=744872 RepID=F8EZJ4_GRAC1|nr:Rrf2 family transcriptional regulator [Gracilinema caldarium]AEJ20217.1 transcriptional regulator, BadM/Rrf2 family [Gracilinema caldarium DSM 7334]